MQPRHVTLVIIALIAGLYYARGLHVAFMRDSSVFLIPAMTLFDAAAPLWPFGRGLGYPLVLAAALATPAPALMIGLTQLALIAATYWVLWRHLEFISAAVFERSSLAPPRWARWLPAMLAATALYSALHALAGAILSEILLATLAGLAVIATTRLVIEPGETMAVVIARTLTAALPTAAVMTVKPHWMIAGVVLSIIIAAAAWFGVRDETRRGDRAGLPAALAIAALPLAILAAVTGLDRAVTSRRAVPEIALFGAHVAFCNNAHLVGKVAAVNPVLRLHDDPAADQRIRAFLVDSVPAGLGRWRLQGFDGDGCLSDHRLEALTAALGPDIATRERAFLAIVARAAVHDPLPFAWRVLRQLGFAIVTPFDRYAVTTETDHPALATSGLAPRLGDTFFAGTRQTGSAGLVAWSTQARDSMPRKVVRVLLGIGFTVLGLLYAALVLSSPILAARRWRTWSGDERRAFLGFVGVPMAAILGHHLLIGLVHSFEIWRYGFNMFFVNLAFLGGAALFWAAHTRAKR